MKSRKFLLTFLDTLGIDCDIRGKIGRIQGITFCSGCSDKNLDNNGVHSHLFIYSRFGLDVNVLKKAFPDAIIEICKGTVKSNIDRMIKVGRFESVHNHISKLTYWVYKCNSPLIARRMNNEFYLGNC